MLEKVIKSRKENLEGYVFVAIMKVLNDDCKKIRVEYESKIKDAINIRLHSSKISIYDNYLNSISINEFQDTKAYIEFNNIDLDCSIKYISNESIDEKKLEKVEKEKRKYLKYKFIFKDPDFPKELVITEESIKIIMETAFYKAVFDINCSWDYFDKIVDKVAERKEELLKELEENGFVEYVLPEENECFDDYDPDDRSTGSCLFCGGRTYNDTLCPDCANNID